LATRQQINQAVEKGVIWLKSKQNADGSYGRWGLGSTGLAAMALLSSNVPNSDLAVTNAVSYILNSTPLGSTYFRSLAVMALVANGEKEPNILNRVRSDAEWLIKAQGSSPDDLLSYGGWGHCGCSKAADSSNTQFAMLALQSAALWDITVPQETWSRAVEWYQRNYDLNKDGSFAYSLGDNSRFKNKRVLYAVTSGALSSMKIINLLSRDLNVKSRAQRLINSALSWLIAHYTVDLNSGVPDSWHYNYLFRDLNSGVPDSWHYNYLFSLQKGCTIEPCFAVIGTYDWYADIADFLAIKQEPDGRWVSKGDKKSTDIVYTSFALLTLTGTGMNNRTKEECAKEENDVNGEHNAGCVVGDSVMRDVGNAVKKDVEKSAGCNAETITRNNVKEENSLKCFRRKESVTEKDTRNCIEVESSAGSAGDKTSMMYAKVKDFKYAKEMMSRVINYMRKLYDTGGPEAGENEKEGGSGSGSKTWGGFAIGLPAVILMIVIGAFLFRLIFCGVHLKKADQQGQ